MLASPTGSVLEQPSHIVANILDPDATGRHKPVIVAENAFFGGVMHIDTVGIVDVDAHDSKRIEIAARFLAELVIDRIERVPINLIGSKLLTVLVENPDFMVGEIVLILLRARDQILAD